MVVGYTMPHASNVKHQVRELMAILSVGSTMIMNDLDGNLWDVLRGGSRVSESK